MKQYPKTDNRSTLQQLRRQPQPQPKWRLQPATLRKLNELLDEQFPVSQARERLAEVAVDDELTRADAIYANWALIMGGPRR